MLRLVWGIVLGALVGGGIAALLIKGLGIVTLGALAAYPLAVLVGALVGLVTGKPIWAAGARIEAGLKAAFGALLAAGLMYALRAWVGFPLDLSSLQMGAGAAGELAAVALPAIGVLLALLFEVDNMVGKDSDGDKGASGDKKRVAGDAASSRARIGDGDTVDAELEEDAGRSARRKR